MAKVTNYVLADRDAEPYYVAVHIPGSKVKCFIIIITISFNLKIFEIF